MESRRETGEYGSNLKQIQELLSLQVKTITKLEYLDFRGVGFVDPFFLKDGISQILAQGAEVHVEMEVNCQGDRDLDYVQRRISEYREFFEGQENRSFYLKISNSTMQECPENFCNFLAEITIENCPNLVWAELPVTAVRCESCESLATFVAPSADEVVFLDCPSLNMVEIPNASTVVLAGCNAILEVESTKVKDARFDTCNSLVSVNLPRAKEVEFEACDSLTQVNIPRARTVQIKDCSGLVQIELPSAEKVHFENCSSLRDVWVPNAYSVTVTSCPHINFLELDPETGVSI